VSTPLENDKALAAVQPTGAGPNGLRKKLSSASSIKVTESMADHWTDQASVSRLEGASPNTTCAARTGAHASPHARISRPKSATFRACVSQTTAIMPA
jgi:hypothetical protein